MTDALVEVVRANRYLGPVPPAALDAVAHAFATSSHAAGHVFSREGERCDEIRLLLRGKVTASHKERLRDHAVGEYGPGELFGLVGSVAGVPQRITCTAAEKCEVATMRREAFLLLRQQSAPIAYAFQKALLAQLARDFRRTDARLRALLPRTAAGIS